MSVMERYILPGQYVNAPFGGGSAFECQVVVSDPTTAPLTLQSALS